MVTREAAAAGNAVADPKLVLLLVMVVVAKLFGGSTFGINPRDVR